MDEKAFFDYQDKKFESVGELLGSILENQDNLLQNLINFNTRMEQIESHIRIKDIVETIAKKNLADFSKDPKAKSTYAKPMPEQIGGYTIAKKGCNRCGGKITWDNYEKINDAGFPQKYPDHIDENGNIIDCPEYKTE